MSLLLALYPRPWRERYGAELTELLDQRPQTWRDRFDIVRGVLDAWLDPQLVAAARPRYPTRADRALGVATAVSGLMLLTWGVAAGLLAPRWESHDPLPAQLDLVSRIGVIGMLGVLVAVAIVVIRFESVMSLSGALGAVTMGAGLLATSGGGGMPALLMLLGGTFAFAPVLTTRIAGRAAGLALVAGTIAIVGGFIAFAATGGQEPKLLYLLAAYGLAWMTVGTALVRGSLTPPVSASLVAAPV